MASRLEHFGKFFLDITDWKAIEKKRQKIIFISTWFFFCPSANPHVFFIAQTISIEFKGEKRNNDFFWFAASTHKTMKNVISTWEGSFSG